MSNKLLDKFFALGDKATGGDPFRKAKYDYYLLWIIFFAFFSIGIGNFNNFLKTGQVSYLGWTVVMLGILWFQYYGLKGARSGVLAMEELRELNKGQPEAKNEEKLDDMKEMMSGFSKKQ